MSKKQELTILVAYLYQALGTKYGLELLSDDPKRARMRLYEARRFCGDPALGVLQFRLSPSDARAILVTKGASKEEDHAS